MSDLPSAETPLETTPTRVGPPSAAAAGFASVYQTARYAWGRAGVLRGTKALLKVNQLDGFDCQSCAWPSPDTERHAFEFCENGAKAVADEATTARVTPEFFARRSVVELAAQSDHWLNQQGRLTHPMVLNPGGTHYSPISWDDAFALIARELNGLASPWEAAFYTSGRTSNEAAFLYQLFVRQFGCNHLPDCSNMCHESSGAALSVAIGTGKGTVTLDDFAHADAIFLFGQNPGTNHPRMLATLQTAKARGTHIVVINPLAEVGTVRFKNPQLLKDPVRALPTLLGSGMSLCDLHVPVRIGGDAAVLKGLMKCLLAAEAERPGEVLDHAFIREHTLGFDVLREALERTSWDEIVAGAGVPRATIEAAATIARRANSVICCWAMGLTQHAHAVATIQEIVNFQLLRGNIGRPGAGLCPVRGHSNVQGDRTMGIFEKMPAWWLERLGREFGFSPPTEPGSDTVDTIRGLHAGRIKVLFALGGNFLSATPDTAFTAEALRRASLTVHVSTKLNRAHLVTGRTALILPCLGRSEIDRQAGGEQFVTVEDSMGIINPSRGFLAPASEHLLSEPMIVARLAEAVLGARSAVPWRELAGDYDRIREHIARVVPGFEDFNVRIRRGVFYLPNPPRDERRFPTRDGKAHFTVHPLPDLALPPRHYRLMTIRTHDQFNTTVYGLDDRYRGIYGGRRVVFLHPEDLRAEGLVGGQFVDLTSHFRGERREARHFMTAAYDIPRGCAAAYFPEANVLVPIDSTAEVSNTPTSKSIVITLTPSPDAEAALEALRHP
ncbi:MAG TPA: FdhF/YdeP family oxidoreductase [Opitutaceae bacterium]